jgi:hypothetical protein
MQIAKPLFALALSTTPAFGQLALYDAGTAGNPAVPPAPGTQGWALRDGGGMGFTPIANDGGLNAWEINDPTPAGTYAYGYYYLNPSGAQFLNILGGAWELTATLKPTAGADPSLFFSVVSGVTIIDTAYRVFFAVQGGDVLVFNGHGGLQFVCPGGADGAYHHFSLRKTNTILYAPVEFLYDGAVLGSVPEDWPGQWGLDFGVSFGTWTDLGSGRGRFHRVEFRTLDDLGVDECAPAQPNSTGAPAVLDAWGSPYVDQNLLELTAASLPLNQFGYVIASTSGAFVPGAGGSQGTLCLGGAIARFVSQSQSSGAGGVFSVPIDLSAIPLGGGTAVAPGETWRFQCWYRDVNPNSTSNFTSVRAITFR